jgi:hypothetical protein
MPTCPACGQRIEIPLRGALETFLCDNCDNPLRVTLRLKAFFLAVFAVVAVFLRALTLAVNPRVSP